jgi:hypothetical protein
VEQSPAKFVISLISHKNQEPPVANNPMDKAAAAFKKEERQREGAKAMTEYRAAQIAEEQKTARLRALRLAREAAGPAAQPTTSPSAAQPAAAKLTTKRRRQKPR